MSPDDSHQKVKKIKSDMKKLEKQNKDKESEERAKKLF